MSFANREAVVKDQPVHLTKSFSVHITPKNRTIQKIRCYGGGMSLLCLRTWEERHINISIVSALTFSFVSHPLFLAFFCEPYCPFSQLF